MMGRTWWGEIFLDVLKECMDEGRLRRGRAYSSPNRIEKFDIKGTKVNAVVIGNMNPYFRVYKTPKYKVSVELKRFSAADWEKVTTAISENAACLSQLLMDEMPTSIDDLFVETGKGLLPSDTSDLVSHCSCPDYASPCKHVAGIYYKLASLLDRDPMLLFQLRGMKFEQLQTQLQKSPLGKALSESREQVNERVESQDHHYTQPAMISYSGGNPRSFWVGDAPLPTVDNANAGPPTSAVLIKRGGDPSFWSLNKPFIEVMETIYSRTVAKNKTSL